ncbi:MAG TPA: glycosyltransferase, partial [Tissierellaceae bacterium]
PTYYEGEGFPGTIIDAFSAGVPVIATDWKYNKEIVAHGENGYIYKGEIEELVNILRQLAQNPDELLKMKKNCIKEAEKYKVENVIGTLIKKLEMD